MIVGDIVDAYDAGQSWYSTWRKTVTQTNGSGVWLDLSMSPGNPVPNYYAAAPLVSTVLARSTDGGLDHGPRMTGDSRKYLAKFLIQNVTAAACPSSYKLLDYLMFSPFVDMSLVGEAQTLTNSATLTRSTDGLGVQIMPVLVAPPLGGLASFTVTYTNSDGVAGRITPTVACNAQLINGTIVTSAAATANCPGPFLPLQGNDKGVRSIEDVTFATGDVGLIALVLVRPLASFTLFDISAPAEVAFAVDRGCVFPRIDDDAYLNLICLPTGSLASAPFSGEIETFWVV